MTLTETAPNNVARFAIPVAKPHIEVRRRVLPSRAIYKAPSKWSAVAAIVAAIALHALAVFIVELERPKELPVDLGPSLDQIAEVTFEDAEPEPIAPVLPDEVFVCVGGGVSPQMGQCVAISSRSSAGKPLLTKKVQFPDQWRAM